MILQFAMRAKERRNASEADRRCRKIVCISRCFFSCSGKLKMLSLSGASMRDLWHDMSSEVTVVHVFITLRNLKQVFRTDLDPLNSKWVRARLKGLEI